MFPFTYHRAASLDEARAAFEGGDDSAYLSGGQTFLPVMKSRLAAPDRLVDLRAIPEMTGISVAGDRVVIGGATTHYTVSTSAQVRLAIPSLAGLAGSIGDAQVRYVGTMGGSVANNDPAADYPSAVLALDATVHTDRRSLPADEFFVDLYETALEPGEILTRIEFPIPMSCGYAKLRNGASRFAIAGVFVVRQASGAVRVAVTGAGSNGVFRPQEIEEVLAADFSAAALADIEVSPDLLMSDMHASADYRAHLIPVLARRAVEGQGQAQVLS